MRILAFLLSGSLLFAQLESNTVTVTAARAVAVQPDQVVFSVFVAAPSTASFEEVLASLQGSGITAAQFSSISSPTQLVTTNPLLSVTPQQQWRFTVPEPLAKFKDTALMLAAFQKTFAQKANGFTLGFTVAGAQASQQLLTPRQCPVSDLIDDARTQAQKLAVAAGLTLGPILALSSASSTGALGGVIAVAPSVAQRSGDFSFSGTGSPFPGNYIPISRISQDSFASFLLGGISTLPPVQPLNCYLTVRFGASLY